MTATVDAMNAQITIDGLHWIERWRIGNGRTGSFVVPFATTRPVKIVTHGEKTFSYGQYGIHLAQQDVLTFLGDERRCIRAKFMDCRTASPTFRTSQDLSFTPTSSRTLIILSPSRLFVLAAAVTVVTSGLMVVFQAHLVGFLTLYALNIGGKVFLGNFCRVLRIRLVPVERLGSVSSLMVLMNQAILPMVGLTLYLLGDQRYSLSGLLLSAIVVTLIASVLISYLVANRPVPTLAPGP